MLKPELYEKTVNILVDAYFNNTLEHGNCSACAVGNLVAAAKGAGFVRIKNEYSGEASIFWNDETFPSWDEVFVTACGEQKITIEQFFGDAKQEILSTGYEVYELAKIEYAFETAPGGNSEDEWMFNGLLAVIDTLDQIHQNTDSNVTASTKQRFVKI